METLKAFIRPPPPCFDYKTAVLGETRSTVAVAHPELMDLVQGGSLVLVQKRRFGPVPEWRRWFVEPDMIWLLGTSHLSEKSATDVERVVRALQPDNVVVELCRSRQVSRRASLHNFHTLNGFFFISKESVIYIRD
jgi:TraB/PrgY/gumN family